MIFYDVLYGPIEIRSKLLAELLETPEFLRLRNVRMLNVDSPACKDLGTASRFAHTVGTCYLAEFLAHQSRMSEEDANILLAAAVIHDMGIPPFGHLVEQFMDELSPPFSHEDLARQVVEGTYAPENKYHQIYAGRALHVGEIFDRRGVDRERVFALVRGKRPTVIAGALDIDNIDNVLRMAVLLGLGNWTDLAHRLTLALRPAANAAEMSDEFERDVSQWLELRATCYSVMMYAPENIAYSALLHDLARTAVSAGIVGRHNWFMTDDQLRALLMEDERTRGTAAQLVAGLEYKSLASAKVVFDGADGPVLTGSRRSSVVSELERVIGIEDCKDVMVFVWYEYAKVSRSVEVTGSAGSIGLPSSSALVALVQRRRGQPGAIVQRAAKDWASLVDRATREMARVIAVIPHDSLDVGRQLIERYGDGHQLSLFPAGSSQLGLR